MIRVKELSDEHVSALLQRLVQKDERALAELHRLMGRRIYAFALHRTGDPDEAETVMVDTLFEVWKHPDRFRGESQFSTWVLGIARYKILTMLRNREKPHEDIEDYAELIESDELQPTAQLEQVQQTHQVKTCMDKLSSDHRDCLHLVFYEGFSLSEVADLQNIPENTVKTRLFHARKNMKGCLERQLAR